MNGNTQFYKNQDHVTCGNVLVAESVHSIELPDCAR